MLHLLRGSPREPPPPAHCPPAPWGQSPNLIQLRVSRFGALTPNFQEAVMPLPLDFLVAISPLIVLFLLWVLGD